MSASAAGRRDAAWAGESTVGRTRLWLGLVLAPTAWLLGELLGYYLTARGCDRALSGVPLPSPSHPATAVIVLEVAAAIVAAIGLVTAVGSLRKTRLGDNRSQSTAHGRMQFMAFTGTIVSALFLLGIVWLGFPAFVVNACNQTR